VSFWRKIDLSVVPFEIYLVRRLSKQTSNKVGERSDRDATATDEELVSLVVAGQIDVFAALYERFYSRVYRMAYGMTGQHQAAEDLVQDVFVRAYQKLKLFAGQSSFATWFYRLALNHCLNHCKSERKRLRLQTTDLVQTPAVPAKQMEDRVLGKELQTEVHRALLSLKPRMRMIVILRDIEGLSYQEIADRMNCSMGTLASQLKRARTLLARKLEHLDVRGTS
jgi:RNA polymerase sigma-70 factor (ECF subfamily)